jgi:hypothetical protein
MISRLISLFKSIIKPTGIQSQSFVPPDTVSLSNGSKKTKFYLNDPTTPNLISEEDVPQKTVFPLEVKGEKGGGYPLGSSEQQSAACKVVLNNALSYLTVILKLVNSNELKGWVGRGALSVVPRAGSDLNAYYDRRSLRFFYYKAKNKVVYACDSTPVVCHEFGHEFLDAMRPDFWSTQSFEVWAYHESFGDMASIISSLQSDDLIKQAIEETGGDLLKSNVITRIGAEMGQTYFSILKEKNGALPSCLRDASVTYKYAIPETLPKDGRDDMLICESHNFSRVFTGAFYEMCVRIAQQILKEGSGKDLLDSVKISRDISSRYLLKATSSVPVTVRLFDAVARQILLIDKNEGSKYQEVIKKVFSDRGILLNKVLMMENKDIDEVKKELKNDPYELNVFSSDRVIRTVSKKEIRIIDKRILSLKNNYLYGLQIEVPSQSSYYFDQNNKLFDVITSTEDEVVNDAINCLDYLDRNRLIGKGPDALFEVKEGKIVRKQIKCKCGLPNYCDPNAPEYNKPWKPANNSSCCKCSGPNCQPRSCDCSSTSTGTSQKKTYCSSKIYTYLGSKYTVGQFFKRKVCSN